MYELIQGKPEHPYIVVDSSHNYDEAADIFWDYWKRLRRTGKTSRFGVHMFVSDRAYAIAIVDRGKPKRGKLA